MDYNEKLIEMLKIVEHIKKYTSNSSIDGIYDQLYLQNKILELDLTDMSITIKEDLLNNLEKVNELMKNMEHNTLFNPNSNLTGNKKLNMEHNTLFNPNSNLTGNKKLRGIAELNTSLHEYIRFILQYDYHIEREFERLIFSLFDKEDVKFSLKTEMLRDVMNKKKLMLTSKDKEGLELMLRRLNEIF